MNNGPLHELSQTGETKMHLASVSDKYGQVYTQQEGTTAFDDPLNEPVGLFRAQDQLAVEILVYYKNRCRQKGCHPDHLESIQRQIDNFRRWREAHPDKVRLPGPEYHPQ